MIRRGFGVAFFVLVMSAVVAAQAYAPIVTMSVTLPDGGKHELTAAESGVATLRLKDGTEYSFRPTIYDGAPWNRIVVTIFKTATATTPTQVLGEIEVERGGSAVDSRTTPAFKVAVPKVSAPAT